jgi:hypothetical protein
MYKSGEEWKPVNNPTARTNTINQPNRVTFDPVEAKVFRLVVQLQAGYSAGILEWKVE